MGMGGTGNPHTRGRTSVIRNGTRPIHAVSSKRSISNCGGTKGRITAGSTGQCTKSRSRQFIRIAGDFGWFRESITDV